MSNLYKEPYQVPAAVLCKRLDELATAVTKGRAAVEREFVMRVPAELDYDPDLVLSEASRRVKRAEELICEIIDGSPLRASFSREEMEINLKEWMIAEFGNPRDDLTEPEAKERWYRDFGVMYHFISDVFPAANVPDDLPRAERRLP